MSETTEGTGFSVRALLAIVAVTAVWGFNFIVIKVGVSGVPPLFLAGLRFTLSAFPALLFVKKPDVGWGKLALYGLAIGVGEFGFLFTAIKLGAPSGLSSIILQSQAFFTAILAAVALGSRPRAHNLAGMAVAGFGLVLIALGGQNATGAGFPGLTLVMVLGAAFFWAVANVVAHTMPKSDGLSLMVWSSLFPPLPLFGLSLIVEGGPAIVESLVNLRPISVGALAYLVILSTLFGYGAWNQIIMRQGAERVAPFSLLVPVFGVSASALVLGERIAPIQAVAAALILAGLALHVFGGRLAKRPKRGA
jgi:O-acetylserine/cysteine efflux transporter